VIGKRPPPGSPFFAVLPPTRASTCIARNQSKILVRELADILKLVEGAQRLKSRVEDAPAMRVGLMALIFLGLYAWAVVQLFF
jgi:hypothetical protein